MEKLLTEGLDYYKPTMSQHHYEFNRDTEVRFTFINRSEQPLLEYVNPDELQEEFDNLREQGWAAPELQHLAEQTRRDGTPLFSGDYLSYLAENKLPPIEVSADGDLSVQTTGKAPLVTFWETTAMARVNRKYFEGFVTANGLRLSDLQNEGDRRLTEKIAILQNDPSIQIADFGTRRRFSPDWHRHVVERLAEECPENLVGTSNVALARELGLKAIGTYAHEMPMVYAGLAQARGENLRDSQAKLRTDWRSLYGKDLSIALTDTYGSEFYFQTATQAEAEADDGLRHDSGDPFNYGERAMQFYTDHGIDPQTKVITYSDGLDFTVIPKIHQRFNNLLKLLYGIGTNLTNDLGLQATNNVMKATHLWTPEGHEADLLKKSDNPKKITGPERLVPIYNVAFAVGQRATRQHVVA